MVSTHKITPTQLRQLATNIQQATKSQDWYALKHLDLKVRGLLLKRPECLEDVTLRTEMNHLKAVHQLALLALREAINDMQTDLDIMQAQQERAKAYQLAMTMEY